MAIARTAMARVCQPPVQSAAPSPRVRRRGGERFVTIAPMQWALETPQTTREGGETCADSWESHSRCSLLALLFAAFGGAQAQSGGQRGELLKDEPCSESSSRPKITMTRKDERQDHDTGPAVRVRLDGPGGARRAQDPGPGRATRGRRRVPWRSQLGFRRHRWSEADARLRETRTATGTSASTRTARSAARPRRRSRTTRPIRRISSGGRTTAGVGLQPVRDRLLHGRRPLLGRPTAAVPAARERTRVRRSECRQPQQQHDPWGTPGTGHTYDAGSDPAVAVDSQWAGLLQLRHFRRVLQRERSLRDAVARWERTVRSTSTSRARSRARRRSSFWSSRTTAAVRLPRQELHRGRSAIRIEPQPRQRLRDVDGVPVRSAERILLGVADLRLDVDRPWHSTWSTPEEISGSNSTTLCFFGNFFDAEPRSAHSATSIRAPTPLSLPNGSLEVIFNNGNTPAGNPNAQQLGVHCSADRAARPPGTAHLELRVASEGRRRCRRRRAAVQLRPRSGGVHPRVASSARTTSCGS